MNDFEEKYKKLHADYYEECGMIMDMINSIEIRLSSFISKVVCKSEYIEVFDRFVMYDSLTFNSKKMLFMNLKSNSLLEKYFPYKKIGGDLDYI